MYSLLLFSAPINAQIMCVPHPYAPDRTELRLEGSRGRIKKKKSSLLLLLSPDLLFLTD